LREVFKILSEMTEVDQFNKLIDHINFWGPHGYEGLFRREAAQRYMPCDVCGKLTRRNITQRRGLCGECNRVRRLIERRCNT